MGEADSDYFVKIFRREVGFARVSIKRETLASPAAEHYPLRRKCDRRAA